jgi:hypothetical protein
VGRPNIDVDGEAAWANPRVKPEEDGSAWNRRLKNFRTIVGSG